MKDLKVLNLSIPTLDSNECKTLMGGDGYAWEIDLPEVVITPDNNRPESPDSDYQDDILDDGQDDYGYDNDLGSDNNDDTSISISEQDLSKLIEGLEKTLANKIVEAWKNGILVKGDGTQKSAAYFDPEKGQIFINDLSVDNTMLVHEFTHYLQSKIGMMGDADDDKGNANFELEANIIQAIMDIADGMYGDRGWISGKHDEEWITKHIEQDEETGVITVDKDLWDWLNNSESMNDFLDMWINYWENNPNRSDTYIEEHQDNWDYNWEQIFKELGFKHK